MPLSFLYNDGSGRHKDDAPAADQAPRRRLSAVVNALITISIATSHDNNHMMRTSRPDWTHASHTKGPRLRPDPIGLEAADGVTDRWRDIMVERIAEVHRNTSETKIRVRINLDGEGKLSANTGVPFLEHMMDQIARHGVIDIEVDCDGDLHIDDHHTVEDIGITLGQAFAQALGNKAGIRRYGHAYVPLDEALSRVVIDFSGRPGLFMQCEFTRGNIGRFDTQLFWEFFQGFVNHAGATLHIDNLKGFNAHHQAETIFKAFGRAVRMAVEEDERMGGRIASTKGSL
jgi:imidazoleglycerol-phosphate dehydratase